MNKILLQPSFEVPPMKHYIYLLFDSDNLVYVGQTVNLLSRIGTHRIDKCFDTVRCFSVKKEWACYLEQALLITTQPKFNKSINFLEDVQAKKRIGEFFIENAAFPKGIVGVLAFRAIFKTFRSGIDDYGAYENLNKLKLCEQIEWLTVQTISNRQESKIANLCNGSLE